jgi:universal stress protein E
MTLAFNAILAVIDPTTDNQRALDRALGLAAQGGATVHAYLCCYSNARAEDFAALQRVEVARHEAWLAALAARYREQGHAFTCEVEWSDDWRESIARAAARRHCELIVKSTYRHSQVRRRLLKTSDWVLLRRAACPVLLVKQETIAPLRCVLAAVDIQADDDAHRQLNSAVVALARQLGASAEDCVVHAVSACEDRERQRQAARLAALAEVDAARAHALLARPEDAIVDCAALVAADLVVVGSVTRHGLGALTTGNTAERALDVLDADVLVVTLRH